jgi:hypothetical protein
MLERTDVISKEFLLPVRFVLIQKIKTSYTYAVRINIFRVAYATTNEYYNEHICYNERGEILLAGVARAFT